MGPREPESDAGFQPSGDAVVTPKPLGNRPSRLQSRRTRLVLALVGGFLALLCLGGVGAFFVFYEESTKIDRATPDQVTSSFLRAYLASRDDQQASLYTCRSGIDLKQLAELREEMTGREQKFGTKVTASWESLTVVGPDEGPRDVSVDLIIAGSKNGQQVSSRSEPWAFKLLDEDGWRVCEARKK